MDQFESNTLLQEAFTQATLTAESKCHTNMKTTWKVAHSPRLTTQGDECDKWFDAGLLPQNNLECKKGGKRRGGRKQRPIKITAPETILYFGNDVLLSFGNDVLLDRITSLQKWALVGRWYFLEIQEAEMMRQWLVKKWKIMLGMSPRW